MMKIYISISVKYFENEKKIDSYDIPKLCTLQQKHQDPKRKVHIYLFIKEEEGYRKF